MLAFVVPVVAALRSTTRSRLERAAEALALRHQLTVLRQRAPKRLRLGRTDRLVWILLSRFWSGWREALQIVSPDTVLAWRRQGFALYWRWRYGHGGSAGRPSVGRPVSSFNEYSEPTRSGVRPGFTRSY
jgi:putative transposase